MPKRTDLRPEKADLRFERANLKPKRHILGLRGLILSEMMNLRPGRPDSRPYRPNWWEDQCTDKGMNKSPPMFHRTLSPSAFQTTAQQVAQGQYVVSDTRCPALHDCELE